MAMGAWTWFGRRLARTAYAQRAMAERADLSAFRKPPTGRLLVGLLLIGTSFLVAWPLIAVLGALALHFGKPLILLIGGPAAYGLSWLTWSCGMLLAGAESTRHGNLFLKWLVRRIVERTADYGPAGSTSSSSSTSE